MRKAGNTIGALIAITIVAQIIAFFRESVFAYYYGTTVSADAYVMASQIPVTLFAIVTTSISTVVLPIYSYKANNESENRANSFLKSFFIIFSLVSAVFILIAVGLAPLIVRLFAPGFDGDSLGLTIRYVRYLFPTVFFSGSIGIFTVLYNVHDNFIYPQGVAFLQNISIIVAIFLLGGKIGTGAAVLGTVAGITFNFLLLFFPKLNIFKEKVSLSSALEDSKTILSRVIPVTIGVGIAEINRLIDRAIASTLDTGSITALNYANKLTTVFSSLVLSAVSMVAFKIFSALFAEDKEEENYDMLLRYISTLLVTLVPITVGAIILKSDLISFAFARGAFDNASLRQTIGVFQFYSIGIVFIAIREIFSKFFYATGNTRTPMINSAIGVVINIVLNLVLSNYMGANGLALATSISSIIICLMMGKKIFKDHSCTGRKIIIAFLKTIISSIIMAVVIVVLNNLINLNQGITRILFSVAVGAIVYFVTLFISDKRLINTLITVLFRRIDKTR